MSYPHKDFVQYESRMILERNGWETKDGHTWTRKDSLPNGLKINKGQGIMRQKISKAEATGMIIGTLIRYAVILAVVIILINYTVKLLKQ